MKALVTGANGFLGRHVVNALLARGIEVRAMVRPAARLEGLGWPSSVEVFRADLRTSRELPARLRGRRRAAPPGGGGLGRGGRAIRGNRGRHRAPAGRHGHQRLPTAGAVQHFLRLRLQRDPSDPRRGLAAAPGAGRLHPRRLHYRQMVARAGDPTLCREARLGSHRAPAWLHLGTRSRLPGCPGPAVRAAPPGHRSADPHTDDPRRELRRRVCAGGGGRARSRPDLECR